MYRKFLTARSPLRLLEKGLHGGLGRGNIGLVLAGHGVGKTSFLVGVALDDLLRGDHVLHIVLGQTVAHTRDFYDTVFEDLASSTHLENHVQLRAEIDRRRSIRAFAADDFDAAKLAHAVRVEEETGGGPALVIVEGLEPAALAAQDFAAWKQVAKALPAELWLSASCKEERALALPAELSAVQGHFDVILALEPGRNDVGLRALKDHDNPDVDALHVALDPRTLLLKRN